MGRSKGAVHVEDDSIGQPDGSADAAVPYYGGNPYQDYDGGKAYARSLYDFPAFLLMFLFSIRFLAPCDNGNCEWVDDPTQYMTTRRWYPTMCVSVIHATHISLLTLS